MDLPLQILVFASHGILTSEAGPTGYLLLQCIHTYIVFDMYILLEVHTVDMIASGQDALNMFSILLNVCCCCI